MFTRSFYIRRSQKCKMTNDFAVIFAILGSTRVKAARKTLMRLTPDPDLWFPSASCRPKCEDKWPELKVKLWFNKLGYSKFLLLSYFGITCSSIMLAFLQYKTFPNLFYLKMSLNKIENSNCDVNEYCQKNYAKFWQQVPDLSKCQQTCTASETKKNQNLGYGWLKVL